MTYSDDYASPQAPFQGDPTGDIFSEPDVVAQSPLTSVRVVETQSGFLVAIKEVDSRYSLSVKRRIGTPPTSHVLLTGDESLKLSRILADKPGQSSRNRDYNITDVTSSPEPAQDPNNLNWEDLKQPLRQRRAAGTVDDATLSLRSTSPRSRSQTKLLLGAAVVALALTGALLALAFVGASHLLEQNSQTVEPVIASSPMETEHVDKFVRNYVANMLDFSPRSYKVSQIQAMSVMKPELLERYWRETNFPLSKKQLSALSGDQTILIEKVVQEPTSTVSTDVDLYAELVTGENKSPIHLKLEVGLNDEGKLSILELKDVSSKKKKN